MFREMYQLRIQSNKSHFTQSRRNRAKSLKASRRVVMIPDISSHLEVTNFQKVRLTRINLNKLARIIQNKMPTVTNLKVTTQATTHKMRSQIMNKSQAALTSKSLCHKEVKRRINRTWKIRTRSSLKILWWWTKELKSRLTSGYRLMKNLNNKLKRLIINNSRN